MPAGGAADVPLAGCTWAISPFVIAGAWTGDGRYSSPRHPVGNCIKDYHSGGSIPSSTSNRPVGAGITSPQSRFALGSGGWTGAGSCKAPKSRLNFLPEETHRFIFTTLAEEFGFVGGFPCWGLYALIIVVLRRGGLASQGPFLVAANPGYRADFCFGLRREHVDW